MDEERASFWTLGNEKRVDPSGMGGTETGRPVPLSCFESKEFGEYILFLMTRSMLLGDREA